MQNVEKKPMFLFSSCSCNANVNVADLGKFNLHLKDLMVLICCNVLNVYINVCYFGINSLNKTMPEDS